MFSFSPIMLYVSWANIPSHHRDTTGPLQALQDAITAYLASPDGTTYAPVLAARAPASASLAAVALLVASPPPELLAANAAALLLDPLLAALPDLGAQIAIMDAIIGAVDALPSRATVVGSLDVLTAMWDLLPTSNRAQPIDDMLQALQGLVDGLLAVVQQSRDTVEGVVTEATSQLRGLRDDGVGAIQNVKERVLPPAQRYNKWYVAVSLPRCIQNNNTK